MGVGGAPLVLATWHACWELRDSAVLLGITQPCQEPDLKASTRTSTGTAPAACLHLPGATAYGTDRLQPGEQPVFVSFYSFAPFKSPFMRER